MLTEATTPAAGLIASPNQATDSAIVPIPLSQLVESPFNPRKTFLDVEGLATSILAEGRIHQPLLVRPLPGNAGNGGTWYELVFGHRRFRAAKMAGLETAPCMVRDMSDAEARSAQIAENLARKDVHPIEEAEGFQALLDTSQTTAEDLAEQTGKSRSYIYARLKLLQACPQVRKACLQGEIGAEVALLVARLRTTKLQEKALAAIKSDHLDMHDGGAKSFRHIRALLAEKFTLRLDTAIFNIESEMLLPSAGHCLRCPKRTGNAPEFTDLVERPASRWDLSSERGAKGSADICTDPDCFDAKKKAHLAAEAARLRAEGHQVVDGNKARSAVGAYGDVKGDFVPLDKVKAALKKAKGKKGAAGTTAEPQVVLIQNPRDGKVIKAVRTADLVAAGVMDKPAAKAAAGGHQRQSDEARKAEHAKLEAEARQEMARRMAVLQAVRDCYATRPRDAFDLRLVAAAAFSGVDWQEQPLLAELHGFKSREALKEGIDHMEVQQLTTLLMDCAIVDNVRVPAYSLDSQPRPLLALAKHYGVDVKAVRAQASGAAKDVVTGDLLQGEADEAQPHPFAQEGTY